MIGERTQRSTLARALHYWTAITTIFTNQCALSYFCNYQLSCTARGHWSIIVQVNNVTVINSSTYNYKNYKQAVFFVFLSCPNNDKNVGIYRIIMTAAKITIGMCLYDNDNPIYKPSQMERKMAAEIDTSVQSLATPRITYTIYHDLSSMVSSIFNHFAAEVYDGLWSIGQTLMC